MNIKIKINLNIITINRKSLKTNFILRIILFLFYINKYIILEQNSKFNFLIEIFYTNFNRFFN